MSGPVKARRIITSRAGGRATVNGADMIMLGSNDYLGLSTDPRVLGAAREAMEAYGSGVCIYPTFTTTELHEALCGELASFLGTEAAMVYSSGGAANSGVLTTLVGEGDLIFSDRLNHASIIDGCRLSRADVIAYPNRDVEGLRQALKTARPARRKLIVTDGIFSMEGGSAPLPEIYAEAQAAGAVLMVDEAHATGVVGPGGTGTAPLHGIANGAPGLILTGSLSKALGGASGGFVAGPAEEIARLQVGSRGWIFTMGMTTANAATALAATRICRAEPELIERLWANVHRLRHAFKNSGLTTYASDSAITGLRIGKEEHAHAVSDALFEAGVYAPAMTYPIVARGEARLRIQVSAAHTDADLDQAAQTIARIVEQATA